MADDKEAPKTKTEKVEKETKAKKAEKSAKAETVEKIEKVEKAVERATGQDKSFNWKNGTMLEKAAFVGSLATIVAAIVCLVCEFSMPAESWPFIWFDITIGLSFICETLTHWCFNRKLAIITGIAGAIFVLIGILKLVGAFPA